MIINFTYKKDMITVDLTTAQIRFLHDYKSHGEIQFISLSRDDIAGYNYLWANDKKLFIKSLKEDIMSNLGIRISGTPKYVRLQ